MQTRHPPPEHQSVPHQEEELVLRVQGKISMKQIEKKENLSQILNEIFLNYSYNNF